MDQAMYPKASAEFARKRGNSRPNRPMSLSLSARASSPVARSIAKRSCAGGAYAHSNLALDVMRHSHGKT
jgi:hypothetical protein